MTDRTVLGKVSFSFAPAQKVVPLKRDRRDSEKRRFERQLKDEAEDGPEDRVDVGAMSPRRDGEGNPGDESSVQDGGSKRQADNKLNEADPSEPGSVIDIHV